MRERMQPRRITQSMGRAVFFGLKRAGRVEVDRLAPITISDLNNARNAIIAEFKGPL